MNHTIFPSASSILKKAEELHQLISKLLSLPTWIEKIEWLHQLKPVQVFLQGTSVQIDLSILSTLAIKERYLILSLAAIEEADTILRSLDATKESQSKLRHLLDTLLQVEEFYAPFGGVIGYHQMFLELLIEQESPRKQLNNISYHHPTGVDLSKEDRETHQAIRWGIEYLPIQAEIYPVGGAGDRLNLHDETTDLPLPAALLQFTGKSLIEGLINDLIAREYLYFKLFNKQLNTPIVLMTSEEKDNDLYIKNIFQKHHWFGRDKENFFFIKQPLVPVITQEGHWSLNNPLELTLKPGGHGVIWKLAEDRGAFKWLDSKNRSKALIRQINNPIAGVDFTLLAMTGIGSQKNKIFGFTSCERPVGSSEGMNLIIEEPTKEGFNYCLTNIEYTDFKQRGIHDLPTSEESHFSQFPSNTNILFVDISTVRETIKQHPLPGRLINLKHRVPYIDKEGVRSTVLGGRIESTMQNIADYFVDHFDRPLSEKELGSDLKTFLVFNSRLKTLSSTKKSFHPNEKPADTPEQAYFDLLLNTRNLLSRCQFTLPVQQSFKDYLEYGPNFIFLYHPALGPLYSIISQKIRGGVFHENSEMQLNIPEVDFENIHIDGSLLIDSNQPLGVLDDQGLLEYANGTNCVLKNVSIRNQGINRSVNRCFWKNQLIRDECFKLFLEEGAEFIAENVSFEGHHEFIVPAYHRMQISQQSNGSLDIDLKPIMTPSWYWKYYFNDGDEIILEKENNN